jgi:hypothetical protein
VVSAVMVMLTKEMVGRMASSSAVQKAVQQLQVSPRNVPLLFFPFETQLMKTRGLTFAGGILREDTKSF